MVAHDPIQRPRLVEALDEQSHQTLILVEGPAGSGKTTVLRQWAEQLSGDRVVFLESEDLSAKTAIIAVMNQLGETDRLPALFAEQDPVALGEAARQIMERHALDRGGLWIIADQPRTAVAADDLLVLEEMLNTTVDSLHLILALTRSPAVPLGHLRSAGRIGRVGYDRLAFDATEIAELARVRLDRELDQRAVQDLLVETGGWAAVIDVVLDAWADRVLPGMVDSIADAEPALDTFLRDGIARWLTEDQAEFLYELAELDEISARECAEVLGRPDADRTLAYLQQRVGFVHCVDPSRKIYQMLGLFRTCLRRLSARFEPGRIGRVAQATAVRERFRTGKVDVAERLVGEQRWHEAIDALGTIVVYPMTDSQILRAGTVADSIPMHAVRSHRYGLQIVATLQVAAGNAARAEQVIDEIAAGLDPDSPMWWVETMFVHGSRAALGPWLGDAAGVIEDACRTLELMDSFPAGLPSGLEPAPFDGSRLVVHGSAGSALMRLGRYEEAKSWFEPPGRDRSNDRLSARLVAVNALAHAITGSLSDACELADRSEALRDALVPKPPLRPETHLARVEVALARNDLEAARRSLDAVAGVGRIRSTHEVAARAAHAEARLALAQGRLRQGLMLCDAWRDDPDTPAAQQIDTSIAATEVRLAVRYGQLDHARRIIDRTEPGHDLYAARALVELVAGDDRALAVCLDTWPTSDRLENRIEYLLFRALQAHRARRDADRRRFLVEATRAADEDGLTRVFLDTAPGIADLLADEAASTADPTVLSVLDRLGLAVDTAEAQSEVVFTPREASVVERLATHLTGAEIAEELGISASTLKSHQRRIYRKLGVGRRSEAVTRLVELGVVQPT